MERSGFISRQEETAERKEIQRTAENTQKEAPERLFSRADSDTKRTTCMVRVCNKPAKQNGINRMEQRSHKGLNVECTKDEGTLV